MSLRPILLSGYAAKSCARATHNRYDATIPEQPAETPADLQKLFDLGNTHEDKIFTYWLDKGGDVVDLRGLDEHKAEHITATIAAMTTGRAVILGGRLPDDPVGGRTGKPDALLASPSGGYHPCDVKAHKVLTSESHSGLTSTLTRPRLGDAVEHELGLRYHDRDLLQLVHYWRMLQACGHAASDPWGSIIGTDTPDEPTLAWYDLDEPLFQTFSRSRGKTRRSSLERYDHEHNFRLRVAQVAQQRTGSPSDPEPLVVPVGQSECGYCAWAPVCVDTLPESDLSAALPPGKVSARPRPRSACS